MTMTFSLQESFELNSTESRIDIASSTAFPFENFHIFTEKYQIPSFENLIERPRLDNLLKKNSEQFGATLVMGRAGTGKTALATEFARQYEQVAWYSVDGADCDWKIFSGYLQASFQEPRLFVKTNENFNVTKSEIAQFIESLFSRLNIIGTKKPLLIVLDDIHHIFDCDWFNDFFNTILYSLTAETHLLMLSRSQPPLPLWRLRSKQVLGVIDEKLLALTLEETKELSARYGFSKREAEMLYEESSGRISKLNFEK